MTKIGLYENILFLDNMSKKDENQFMGLDKPRGTILYALL